MKRISGVKTSTLLGAMLAVYLGVAALRGGFFGADVWVAGVLAVLVAVLPERRGGPAVPPGTAPHAGPPGAWEKARKFLRIFNWNVVVMAALLLFIGIVGFGKPSTRDGVTVSPGFTYVCLAAGIIMVIEESLRFFKRPADPAARTANAWKTAAKATKAGPDNPAPAPISTARDPWRTGMKQYEKAMKKLGKR